jgi:hypothetical protein
MTKITVFLLLIFLSVYSFGKYTIPFKIGMNNKIYIKVRINNSDALNFMYNTGADICAVKKSILHKNFKFKY